MAADRDPESIDRLLAERGIRPIDFAGWKKVDAFERAEGAKEGREHKKVIEPDQMRELAHADGRPRPSGTRPAFVRHSSTRRAPCGRGRARGRTGRANMGHCAWRISSNHSACDFSVCIMDAKVRVHGHFNGLKTTLLFALMWAIIMLIWWATGGSRQTLSIYIVIGLITTFGTYWFSDKLAIASMARGKSASRKPRRSTRLCVN